MVENGDDDDIDGDDHDQFIENDEEGATTGAIEHKWKGLSVTEKEDKKETKMFNYIQLATSISYLQSILLILRHRTLPRKSKKNREQKSNDLSCKRCQ